MRVVVMVRIIRGISIISTIWIRWVIREILGNVGVFARGRGS